LLALKGAGDRVAFSPDGKRLASAGRGGPSPMGQDSRVKVWDAQTGQELLALKGAIGDYSGVAFSPDGQRLTSASDDKTAKVWDAQTGQQPLTLQNALPLKEGTAIDTSVAFSPDGKRLASANTGGLVSETGAVKVWDARTGQEVLTLKGGGFSVAFSPDGKR